MYAGRERRNRVVALVLAVALLAGVVLAFLATVAQATPARAAQAPQAALSVLPAHARLVSVVPADGARLESGPTNVVLTFDDSVSPQFAQVRLTRDGEQVALTDPTVDGAVVRADVTGPAGPGAYRVVFQVTSDDGHPVSGESAFAVGGAALPRPKVTPTYKTPQMQPTTFGHPDHRPGLIVAGSLLLAGVALLVFEHRRRRAQAAGTDQRDEQRIS